MVSVTSREFNQDVGAAKRAAANETVIITDRGEPAYVLMSIDEYRRLSGPRRSLADILHADDDIEIEIEPRRIEPDRELFLDDAR